MGVDIKSFYLAASLPEYEYMKMPLSVFPKHVHDQYNLETHAKNRFVYLEIYRAIYVYGLPQAGILANKLATISTMKYRTHRDYRNMYQGPSNFHWSLMTLVSNTSARNMQTIYSTPYRSTIHEPSIGRETYTVESSSIGT